MRSSIKGKKGKTRADAVRKKWERLKKGKFESEKEKLMFDNLLKKKRGVLAKTSIGLKNVYKNLEIESCFISNEKLKTIYGYNLLKEKGLPVTKHIKTVKIRGKEMEVFEKARDLTKKETQERINEIIKIIEKASKEGLFIDAKIENFGVNKDGKIVIRDTNFVKEGRNPIDALYDNLLILEIDTEMYEKIGKMRKKIKPKF